VIRGRPGQPQDIDGQAELGDGGAAHLLSQALGEPVDVGGVGNGGLVEPPGDRIGVDRQAPMPAAAANPFVTLSSVSCASARTCTAVGNYTDSSGGRQGLLVTQTSYYPPQHLR
jgi:hypothetical protein